MAGPEEKTDSPEQSGEDASIMDLLGGISEAVVSLTETVGGIQTQIDSLRESPPTAKLRTYDPPNLADLKAGEMGDKREIYTRATMQDPKFLKGQEVILKADSDLAKRLAKKGKTNVSGIIADVPKGITTDKDWKYNVHLRGIGKDGIAERDLEYAQPTA